MFYINWFSYLPLLVLAVANALDDHAVDHASGVLPWVEWSDLEKKLQKSLGVEWLVEKHHCSWIFIRWPTQEDLSTKFLSGVIIVDELGWIYLLTSCSCRVWIRFRVELDRRVEGVAIAPQRIVYWRDPSSSKIIHIIRSPFHVTVEYIAECEAFLAENGSVELAPSIPCSKRDIK